MDYSSPIFVNDLRNALRCGMTEALRHHNSLAAVDVTGVERTLYPMIRDYALKYLQAQGYNYLTDDPNFFVIGETSILGTKRKADGFICAPDIGQPIYALEVKIAGLDEFEEDYRKVTNEWSGTGLLGAFILLFDRKKDCRDVYRLDGATLTTPRNDGFAIMPLILPLDPSVEDAFESATCYEYFRRHGRQLFVTALTLSGIRWTRTVPWTSDVIAPVIEQGSKRLLNSIVETENFQPARFQTFLNRNPSLIVLQGGRCPFRSFDAPSRRLFGEYLERHKPVVVIFANKKFEGQEWEDDSTMSSLLPVVFNPNLVNGLREVFFGTDIRPGQNPTLHLEGLNDTAQSVKGFAMAEPKPDRELTIDMTVRFEDQVYPFVVTEPDRRIVFVASGTGNWGLPWYKNYSEGFQMFWNEVLTKFHILDALAG